METSRESKLKNDNPQILFFVPNFEGLGDLFFGVKVSELLKNNYPNTQITIITNQKSIDELKRIAEEELKNVNMVDAQTLFSHVDNNNREWLYNMGFKLKDNKLSADLMIEGPVFAYLQVYGTYLDKNTNLLLMPAYNDETFGPEQAQSGFTKVTTMETGFGNGHALPEKRKGILIDKDLKDFTEADPKTKHQLRVQALSQLSGHLGDKLRGKESPENYLTKTEVAFAYYPEKMPHYGTAALTIAATQKNTKKNVDFLVTGNLDKVKQTLKDPDLINRIKHNGFTHIEFVSLDSTKKSEVWAQPKIGLGSKKVFRVLYRPSFEHEDVKNLLKLVNIAGITGNQSLSEAISVGAVPVYSLFPFDRPVFNKLVKYLNDNGGEQAAEIFRKLSNMAATPHDTIQLFGEQLSNVEVREQFAKAFYKLRQEYDLGSHILPTVETLLASQKMEEKNEISQSRRPRANAFKFFQAPEINDKDDTEIFKNAKEYINNNMGRLDINELNDLMGEEYSVEAIKSTQQKDTVMIISKSVYSGEEDQKKVLYLPREIIENFARLNINKTPQNQ